jgi:transposase
MPKPRPPHPPAFHRQMVDLVRAGRDPEDLAKEREPAAQPIRYWVAVANRQEGRRSDKTENL